MQKYRYYLEHAEERQKAHIDTGERRRASDNTEEGVV